MADLSRAVWGVALLTAPRPLLRALGTPAYPRTVATARLLGARHLVQAVATALRPTRTARVLGAAVDGTHALTAVAVAARDPRLRAPALVEIGLAAAWIAASQEDADPAADSMKEGV